MILELGEPDGPKGILCPHCNIPLAMTVREKIEIDYCPQCRGVWLDRGELDKIIERSLSDLAPAPAPQHTHEQSPRDRDRDDRERDRKRGKKSKRKSWLYEIFDELT